MANRADRRRKPQQASLPKSQEVMLRRMCQNGITPKDLENEWHKGHDVGRDAAIRTCYAAVCKAARDAGMDKKAAYDLLCKMDDHVCNTLSSVEAIDEVFKEMGIEIRFRNDPFDRIYQRER